MKLKWLATLAVAMAFFSSVSSAQGVWVNADGGFIPNRAWVVGRDSNDSPLFLCRARAMGGVHPGKIRDDFEGCHISYGGREISKSTYQVYVGSPRGMWRFARGGMIPRGAVPIGSDSNGEALFLCRAFFHGMQPGKIRPGIPGCDIAYDGEEITKNSYSVFVRPSQYDDDIQ